MGRRARWVVVAQGAEAGVPGRAGLLYRFAFSEAGRVSDFALHAERMGACAG